MNYARFTKSCHILCLLVKWYVRNSSCKIVILHDLVHGDAKQWVILALLYNSCLLYDAETYCRGPSFTERLNVLCLRILRNEVLVLCDMQYLQMLCMQHSLFLVSILLVACSKTVRGSVDSCMLAT